MTTDRPRRRRHARVARKLRGMPASDGAGVKLTRVIGTPQLDMLDPFLMLDEFGTDQPEDYLAGFPDHPHRGFETVTYMLDGRMRHKDNHGNEGLLVPGSVQWMTAGRGLVHSEMPEQQEGRMRGFQLWVNLPAQRQDGRRRATRNSRRAAFRCVTPDAGVRVKVIAGEVDGVARPDRAAGDAIRSTSTSRLDAGARWEYDAARGPQRLRVRVRGRRVDRRGRGCARRCRRTSSRCWAAASISRCARAATARA